MRYIATQQQPNRGRSLSGQCFICDIPSLSHCIKEKNVDDKFCHFMVLVNWAMWAPSPGTPTRGILCLGDV